MRPQPMPLLSREKAIQSALFNARMEGFHVPKSVIRASYKVLQGTVKADDLVLQYKLQFSRQRSKK